MENGNNIKKVELCVIKDDNTDFNVVYSRFNKLSKLLGIPNLTPKNLRNSGMLYEAFILYMDDREFRLSQLYRVCEFFNVSKQKRGFTIMLRIKRISRILKH
jgi:hypothetical protein